MVVHMFRVCVSVEGMTQSELETAVDDWIAQHTKWDGQSVPFEITAVQGDIENPDTEYYRGDFRFIRDDTKDNVLQKLTDKLDNKVEWHRVGYHACTHDEQEPHSCSWDSVNEWTAKDVTVPAYVPDMS